MDEPILLSRHDGGIAVLTFNRAERLNSLGLGDVKVLLGRLEALAADGRTRALVITGAGRGFCAGWLLETDGIPGLPGESLGTRQAHLMEAWFNPVIETLHQLPIPSVAAVNGVAAGMGVSIALAADVVLAADTASFVLTFAPKLGIVPDMGATWKLPRLIGWARAQAVAMLGERISADAAERWGMIWRKVEPAGLLDDALALARRLAEAPPGACREVRMAFEAAQLKDLAAQLDFERLRQRELLDKPSFEEGLKAFQEKRAPNFQR